MKKIIAKFKCSTMIDMPSDTIQVTLSAVKDGCEENKSFARAWPTAYITLNVSNETPGGSLFEIGKEYCVTFEEIK